MTVTTLNILGRGNQSLAPVSGTDLVPLGYLTTALAGYAPLTHLQTSATITDFAPAVLALLAANGVPLSGSGSVNLLSNGGLKLTGGLLGIDSGITSVVGHHHVATEITDFNTSVAAWALANGVALSGTGGVNLLSNGGLKLTGGLLGIDSGITSVVGHHHVVAALDDFSSGVLNVLAANGVPLSGTGGVSLLPFGGLKYTGSLLGIDSGTVAKVGHTHRSADITDLASGVQTLVRNNLMSSATVGISGTGPLTANVLPAIQGGLLVSNAGVGVDFGSGHYQVAAGDHTHALLHNPITLEAMSSLSGTLSGQQVILEVRPVLGGGILVTPSGVAVDFSVVQRAGMPVSGTAITTANTATVLLGLMGNVLSGTIPLDANPPGGTGGKIIAGAGGLRVVLGTLATTAAAGNHTHNVVTSGTDGFMAASDKVKLDALSTTMGLVRGVVTTNTLGLAVDGGGNLSGTVTFNPAPVTAGKGALGQDASGLYVALGTTANTAAAGNHLHDARYLQIVGAQATSFTISGTLTLIGAPAGAPANPGNLSGVVAWFAASVNGTNYKIPLFQ